MNSPRYPLKPAQLLTDHADVFNKSSMNGPILDLSCGDGHNGIFLASRGLPVICCDISNEALTRAKKLAEENGVNIKFWQLDLEGGEINPLPKESFGGILVFRYLHRPLIPCIKKSLKQGGILIYETFTLEQPKFGRPHNPNFLLKKGELFGWFKDWEIIHHFEGTKENPTRALAQIVCRRPTRN